MNGIFQLLLLQRIAGDHIGVFVFQCIENRKTVLVLIGQQLLATAEVGGAAVIGDLPAPGDKGGGFLQIADGLQNLDEGILGQICGKLRIADSFHNEIVNILVKGVVKLCGGIVLTLLNSL